MVRADEIDTALTLVLKKIEYGEITDGGADTLLGAANAGTQQGVAQLGIPGPPPNPPVDKGAGEHGSDPWYTRLDDFLMKGVINDVARLADGWGWTHAAANLRHYLGNSGEDIQVDPDEMLRDDEIFRSSVKETATNSIRDLVNEVKARGEYGQPVQFSTGWKNFTANQELYPDWYFAMGSLTYATTGVVTVHPPDFPGGEPRVEVDYQTHVFDRYNWDGGKSTQIGPIVVEDQQLADLHLAGVAQEFNISGSSDAQHFEGVVPPSDQSFELPAPPDNRNHTRTDPGR